MKKWHKVLQAGALVALAVGAANAEIEVKPSDALQVSLTGYFTVKLSDGANAEFSNLTVKELMEKKVIEKTVKDYEKLKNDAASGDAKAQYRLANVYLGIERIGKMHIEGKQSEYLTWLTLAAEDGLTEAQYGLGDHYKSPQSYIESAKWYRKAAEKGDGYSLYALGEFYERGFGVPKNYVISYMYYNLAIPLLPSHKSNYREYFLEYSMDSRNELERLLPPEQLAQAQEMSVRCLKNNYKNCDAP